MSLDLLQFCNFNLFDVNNLLTLFNDYSFVQRDIMIYLVKNKILSDKEFINNFFRNLLLTDTEKGNKIL